MNAKEFIPELPGKIRKADGTVTDVLTALGISVSAMNVGNFNSGYGNPPIGCVELDGKQYSIYDILNAIGKGSTVQKKQANADKGKVLYVNSSANVAAVKAETILDLAAINIKSSTEGSSKTFHLSVDDDGTITAVENA